jgi:hypothetical protein
MNHSLFRRCLSALGAVVLTACAGTSVKPSGDAERSKAAFIEMAKVMTHPRCLNCHVQGDSPTQGDAMTMHEPPVVRGNSGMGVPGMRCSTCHTEANVTLADHGGSVPGAPTWQLPPATMAWQGKSPGQICEQLKDPARNAGVSLEDIWKRNNSDPVTAWAWAPGAGRTPAPGTQAELAKQTRIWIDNGAHCPN